MNGVCLIQIFQLDFFSAAAAVRFGVFIRLNFDSISDHGRPCALVYVQKRARARVERPLFTIWWKKKCILQILVLQSRIELSIHCVSLALTGHAVPSSDSTHNKWNRSCVYVFSSLCIHIFHLLSFAIAFDSFPLSFFFSSSWIRFGRSFVSFVCLVALLVTWSFETKRGSWTLCHRR